MSRTPTHLIAGALFLLSACATPTVNRSDSNFDEQKFVSDLDRCRGGTIVEASAKTVGIAIVGSAIGAVNGATVGLIAGSGWEGAAIGAVVGATVGTVVGASIAIEKHKTEIADCLREKGYQSLEP